MRSLAKKKFFWPGMSSSLEEKYLGCEPCKVDSISHHKKAHQAIPENLQLLAPGEQISIDFAVFNNKPMLVVKNHVSGLLWAKVTKDQTTEEAFKGVMELAYRAGIPHKCRSDGAGSFLSRFSDNLKEVGI